MHRCALRSLAVVVVASMPLFATAARAQGARVFSPAEYDRAAAQLQPSLNGLMVGGSVQANWLPDDRLWYRTIGTPAQIILIDPAKKSRVVCDATRSNCPGGAKKCLT